VQVYLLLRRATGRSSSETVSELVEASLEGGAYIFSPICDSKIKTTEDVGTNAIEICIVKTS